MYCIALVCDSLSSTVIMTSSIRVFQFIRNFHQTIGIYYPSQPNQKQISLNLENNVFFFSFTHYTLTEVAFLVFEANSIIDYAFGFIPLCSAFVGFLIYILFMWQLENTFKFFENCEKFIEKRRYQIEFEHNVLFLSINCVTILKRFI